MPISYVCILAELDWYFGIHWMDEFFYHFLSPLRVA